MSFTENDRKIQSQSGKTFPAESPPDRPPFAQVIASALREEFGGGPSAVKTVARLARANERAVRNWFEAKNGPSGERLIPLLRHSDAVLRAVLDLSDRRSLRAAAGVIELRQQLIDLVAAIDEVQPPSGGPNAQPGSPHGPGRPYGA
jgi:hypothetical protein